ncbi:hypothetical protein [Phnomibacter sp. MR]|uniref:hypothetical protein n=1 Tax=Phnomibacter sp. MR TaxID=3042318 RepID=UPI003A7F75F4
MKLLFTYPFRLVLPALLMLTFVACQKTVDNNDDDPSTPTNPGNTTRLSYGDTLFYLRATANANLVNPVTKPVGNGYFLSIPKGLSLDSTTGRINLALSETGIRYKIYFVPQNGTQATDSVRLVISGVDYEDKVYTMNTTPNRYDTAFPIYNAIPGLALPCLPDDDDDDDGCYFDETDLNNDGNDDIAGVIQSKLLVDRAMGTLDLEASFEAGIFGGSNPANGTEGSFTMYYRLNDASNRALNKITVRIIYYERRIDIPRSLLNEIDRRNNSRILGRTIITPGLVQRNPASIGRLTSVDLIRSTYTREKRPPMIILTKSL